MDGTTLLIKELMTNETAYRRYLTPSTIAHFRHMGYKVTTWDTLTLISRGGKVGA